MGPIPDWLDTVQINRILKSYLPYECGFEAFGMPGCNSDVVIICLAILFIVFDLETAFLIPWVCIEGSRDAGFVVMAICFFVELFIGFVYLWKKGALEWE